MRSFLSPRKQKFFIVSTAVVLALLGLEGASSALAYNQILIFVRISFYTFIALAIWQVFIFDLHLKPARSYGVLKRSFVSAIGHRFSYLAHGHHFWHYLNYLILPSIIYWATVLLLFLNPFDPVLKQIWIGMAMLGLGTASWYLKTIFYAHKEASFLARQFIFLAKILASYLAFTAALGIAKYFEPGALGFVPVGAAGFTMGVFSLSVLLMYQALFQHHYLGYSTLSFLLGVGLLLGIVAYAVYELWNINYFSGGLVIASVYNTIWGIVHHKYIDKNLTRKIVYEYVSVLFVILVIIIGSTNFASRI